MEIPGVTTPKKSIWLKIVLIAIGLFVVFVGLIVGCVFSMGAPVMKAGETFLKQIAAGQVDQAYQATSKQFQQNISREKLDAFLQAYPVFAHTKTVSFNEFSIQNDNFATINGTITAADGQVSKVSMDLVKENGEWRIVYFGTLPSSEIPSSNEAQQQQTASNGAQNEQVTNPGQNTQAMPEPEQSKNAPTAVTQPAPAPAN
jgi:hypothetical protein